MLGVCEVGDRYHSYVVFSCSLLMVVKGSECQILDRTFKGFGVRVGFRVRVGVSVYIQKLLCVRYICRR